MAATFTIKIHKVYTKDESGLINVIKRVDWTLSGAQDSQTTPLSPQSTELSLANTDSFIPYDSLTEATVVSWVEANSPQLDILKSHLQVYLDRMCLLATYNSPPLPWPSDVSYTSPD